MVVQLMHDTQTAMADMIIELHNHRGIMMRSELDSWGARARRLAESSREQFDVHEANVRRLSASTSIWYWIRRICRGF